MNSNKYPLCLRKLRAPFVIMLTVVLSATASAQAVTAIDTVSAPTQAIPATTGTANGTDTDLVIMSPFEVRASSDTGYQASETLAGNRLNTNLRDLGNAVSVINSQFLQDIGATNAEDLLTYTTSSEVSSIRGNFAGFGDGRLLQEDTSSSTNRVRGLAAADNTRDFFRTNIPWETYNTDGVDLQRGPNSILFGQGSPAGIINTRLKQALFKNGTSVSFRVDDEGSVRTVLDTNQVLMRRELAVRVIGLSNQQEYKQEPAFVHDKRVYAALRYEPRFLRFGSARTIIKVNFEGGKVDSNRPHILPPNDAVTPWFLDGTVDGRRSNDTWATFPNLNKSTYVPQQASDNNSGLPNMGQTYQILDVGGVVTPNPYYSPWVGGIGRVGGATGLFDFIGDGGSTGYVMRAHAQGRGGLSTSGTVAGSIAGEPYATMVGIPLYSDYAISAGLPLSEFGQYKNKVITDPSIFNFYKQMLEGDNKSEKSKFNAVNVNIAQTFFHDHLGLEAAYNRESVRDQRTAFLNYDRYTIYVDINSVYTDGTPDGNPLNGFADGTPNPNVGRPYTVDDGKSGNTINWTDREAMRLTGFARYDFGQRHKGWWARVLGRQTVTGLLARETVETDRRQFYQWGNLDPNYRNNQMVPGSSYFNEGELSYNVVTYLGGSIASRTSASGANIPGMSQIVGPRGTVQARVFNSRWNAPGVNPADPWTNERYPVGHPSRESKQNANPANYVGWTTIPVQIVRAEDGYRDQLTTQANLRKIQVDSQALVWQGNFWDNTIVMTGGIRRDHARRWERSLSLSGASFLDLSPGNYRLPDEVNTGGDMKSTSRSGMIVVHLTNFISRNLPVSVSAFYNRSKNFQPESGRVDVYGEPLPLPSGDTKDYGVLLETRNRKLSLRVTRYETKAKNVSSNALTGAYYLGRSFADGQNYVNRYEYDWDGFTSATAIPTPNPGNGKYNYIPDAGENWDDARAREAAAIAGWRAWEAQVDPRFLKAWGINLQNPLDGIDQVRSTTPVGFALTEDATSKGYEIEFTAQPLPNWRISINASKTDASRSNIGGPNLVDFITTYENVLQTTKAGDVRLYWGDTTQPTTRLQWRKEIGTEWWQRSLQEGSRIAEMREWRANMITTYNFRKGFLKGFRVGAGVRWQDEVAIGYPTIALDKDGNVVDPTVVNPFSATYDVGNPYMGPSETNIDLWVGYNRRLFKGRITWDIQLNVRDVGKKDGLIPINTQPDGSAAAYRIRYGQSWSLSSSFKF